MTYYVELWDEMKEWLNDQNDESLSGEQELPQCGNCPHFEPMSIKDERSYCNKINHEQLTVSDVVLIMKLGCASHPQAREYLMADVLMELDRLSNQNVGSSYRYALNEAITLIREGVKK